MNIRFGFSTGCFFRSGLNLIRKVEIIKDAGCNAIELGFVKINEHDLGEITKLTSKHLDSFDHVSLHAPILEYGENKETEKIFEIIRRIGIIRKLDLVVFHPNTVKNFRVFDNLDFPVAFENMDYRKATYKYPEEFEEIFNQNNKLQLVLDVNHVYTNNPSLDLAIAFYEKWGDRVAQVHLSGYDGYHAPLFQTQQKGIIMAIQNFNIPIIVEGVMSVTAIQKERDYILEIIEELQY